MEAVAERTVWNWLFNPFRYIAGAGALGLGLLAIILMAVLGYLGHTHLDGVLDVHAGPPGPLHDFILQGLLDWLLLSLTLLATALILRLKFRLIDLWGTQALAAAHSGRVAGLSAGGAQL